MKKWLVLVAVLLLALVPLLSAGKGDPAAGKAVYAKKCGACHGPAGEPKEAIAKMFKVEMRHLGAKEVQAKTDDELKKLVTEGIGKMKPIKDIPAGDLDNLIAFMRTLKK